jgi:glycine C-acetyltransferase
VDKLAALAEKYGAIMMVDDAHASGVLGRNGRGSVDHFGMHGKVDVQVGTTFWRLSPNASSGCGRIHVTSRANSSGWDSTSAG